ncbi:MAG: SDR family NAD(P)-dependent oxidoreductase [Flavobacteriales bacterium]|nr:SDR family NAD(P)-dependent oxidoreductase [Flavobacteriales bacterium]
MKIFMTGATSGLGIEAAVALADQGHDLYVLGRTQEKIETLIAIASKRS